MSNALPIDLPPDRLESFCRKWDVVELALFGSVLREDFTPTGDVDVLVTLAEGSHHGLFDLVEMKQELEALLGRKVDLVSRRGVEASRNALRRRAILDSARVVYAAPRQSSLTTTARRHNVRQDDNHDTIPVEN